MVMLITKVTRIALILGLVLLWGILPVSAVPILSIEPLSKVVQPGQSFSLDVRISDITDLFTLQFDLTFTPGVLSALSIAEGPFLPSGGATFFISGIIDNVGGTIATTGDSLIGAIAGVNGSGTLATISFQALALGTSPITLSNVMLLDSNLGDITARLTDGTVNITAIPEPSTFFLIAIGLLGYLYSDRRKRKRA
jgi:hypothetical protein